jgi:hypothetical protein
MPSSQLDHEDAPPDARAPAWFRLFAMAAVAALVHQACALNPQPIPPDEAEPSYDAGRGVDNSSSGSTGFPGAADSGPSSSGGGGSSGSSEQPDAGDVGDADAGDAGDVDAGDAGDDAGDPDPGDAG